MVELGFGDTSDKLKEEYLDMCKGIQSEILSTMQFNEISDLSTTYLGKVYRSKTKKLKWKSHFLYQNKGTPWESC